MGTARARFCEGPIEPIRTTLVYRLGVSLVACAMVLLPALYVALIVLSAMGIWLYTTIIFVPVLLTARRSDPVMMAAAPIPAGIIAIIFLLKPFFGGRPRPLRPMPLAEDQAPGLFRLVHELCEIVGAPRPTRIAVDVRVNASASLRHGLWSLLSNDLVLTIGLPLVDGLTLRQFAGVLAHEFGHFSQGAGIRVGVVIRVVNAWFAAVVYGEDSWDRWLLNWSRTSTVSATKFMGVVALTCVWLSRVVLRVLMFAGHLVSMWFSRQMEFDADQAEARLVGSHTFAETSRRLHVLDLAAAGARADLDLAWRTRQPIPDFTELVRVRREQLSPEQVSQALTRCLTSTPTMYDSHPSTGVRIARAASPAWDGVFLGDGDARSLFADFTSLSRDASIHYYEERLASAQNP